MRLPLLIEVAALVAAFILGYTVGVNRGYDGAAAECKAHGEFFTDARTYECKVKE